MSTAWWFVLSALTIIPLFKLLPHFGIKQYWAFAAIVPLGTLVLLWVMAMKLQDLEKL